jgi:ATP-dependent DNA helicase PIF1
MGKTSFTYNGEEMVIELTEEFEKAYDRMEFGDRSFFITGKAGTGKSTLLKMFRAKTKKNVAVVAFTGLAAINVDGVTIHSFFKFPLGFIHSNQVKIDKDIQDLTRDIDTIIIDEVSMLRADIMDAIDKSLRINRDKPEPFGGVQMIFIGDLYQLPPIVEKELSDVYSKYYKTPYFFSADVFDFMKLPYINLEKIHRQSDPEFIEILNNIRERKNLSSTLEKLNKNVVKSMQEQYKELKDGDTVVLSTTNEKVREVNQFFLDKIDLMAHSFDANVKGDFDMKSYPTEDRLFLKEGAKVMFIKNDPDKCYVNGDIGIITKLTSFSIEVKCKGGTLIVKKHKWEKTKYKYVPSEIEGKKGTVERVVVGEFEQYPLRLAWAITIHKSQGQTYNKVLIDFHKGSFTSGQTYVALSRCKSLEGIQLQRKIEQSDIILDHRITEFARTFENV